MVVGVDNPVESLSRAESQAVFNGRIPNWSSLAGSDQPITLLSRERGSGARTLFEQRVLAEQRLSINALLLSGNTALLEAVAATPEPVGVRCWGLWTG
ncbi:MAG: substrate-binding domain-containing protein [Dehalococcoidia bacterium]|nr:substrate-binding domain-containing protein [Dehalococcoidia bacterium]